MTATSTTDKSAATSKYAPKKREPNDREKRRIAEKLRRNVRNKKNARHG